MLLESTESVSRRAASVSRHAPLLPLSGTAAAEFQREVAANKKRKKKKSGKNCKKDERKRCNKDAAACIPLVTGFCAGNPDPAACQAQLTPCCETCAANEFLTCLAAGL